MIDLNRDHCRCSSFNNLDLLLGQVLFLLVGQCVICSLRALDSRSIVNCQLLRRLRERIDCIRDILSRLQIINFLLAGSQLRNQSSVNRFLRFFVQRLVKTISNVNVACVRKCDLANVWKTLNQTFHIGRAAILNDLNRVLCRNRQCTRGIHGRPRSLTDADIDYIARNDGHDLAALITRVFDVVAVEVGASLIVFIGGLIGHSDCGGAAGDHKQIRGRTLFQGFRHQLTTGQGHG